MVQIVRFRYVLWVLLLVPAFIFRDYTPSNELRYISIAEEAIANNTWWTFYNHGVAYADKPPLYFWLIMWARMLSGEYHFWIMGLYSLLPATGILYIMDRWMRKEEEACHPVASNLLLLTSTLFLAGSLVLRMDMLMTFFIVLSLYTFFRIYRNEHHPVERWLLPVFIFLAVFAKGPAGLLMPAVSIAAFLLINRKIKTIGRYLGWKQWGILTLLCGLWFLMVRLEGDAEYLNNILFKQTVGRGINSFHHKEPFWYYLPRLAWTLAPWSLLFGGLLWLGIRKKMITTDTGKFFLTVAGVNLLMMSLVSAKLDIYLLPVYPFLVYLCATLLIKNQDHRFIRATVAIPACLFMLLLPAFTVFRDQLPYAIGQPAMIYAGLLVIAVGGAVALVRLYRKKTVQAVASVGAAMLVGVCLFSFAIPQFNNRLGFRAMASEAKAAAEQEGVDIYAYYRYPSLADMDVFLGKKLQRVESVAELDSLARLPRRCLLFVRNRDRQRHPELERRLKPYRSGCQAGDFNWYIVGNEEGD